MTAKIHSIGFEWSFEAWKLSDCNLFSYCLFRQTLTIFISIWRETEQGSFSSSSSGVSDVVTCSVYGSEFWLEVTYRSDCERICCGCNNREVQVIKGQTVILRFSYVSYLCVPTHRHLPSHTPTCSDLASPNLICSGIYSYRFSPNYTGGPVWRAIPMQLEIVYHDTSWGQYYCTR